MIRAEMIARIHTLAAVVALLPLLVFAVTGIFVPLHSPPMTSGGTRSIAFDSAPDATDLDTAERVVAILGLSLATPIQKPAIQHDDSGRLLLDFYHANGRTRVLVIPAEHRLQIDAWRSTLPRYLDILHMTTAAFRTGDWRMRAWSWLNELALWCVVALLITGTALVFTRRRPKPATIRGGHHFTALLTLPVVLVFGLSALQMAHRTWFPASAFFTWIGRVHRNVIPMSYLFAFGLLSLVATGLTLWWPLRRYRIIGVVAAVTAIALLVAMRGL